MEWFEKLKEDMNAHASRDYPRECVGIITNDFTYIPCKNLSDKPNIWGIFHSHPGDTNPIPSKEDKHSAAFNQYKFLVGFNNKFFIYWYDSALDVLRYDLLEEKHFDN